MVHSFVMSGESRHSVPEIPNSYGVAQLCRAVDGIMYFNLRLSVAVERRKRKRRTVKQPKTKVTKKSISRDSKAAVHIYRAAPSFEYTLNA